MGKLRAAAPVSWRQVSARARERDQEKASGTRSLGRHRPNSLTSTRSNALVQLLLS